jgi:cellulose synthase operon protein C
MKCRRIWFLFACVCMFGSAKGAGDDCPPGPGSPGWLEYQMSRREKRIDLEREAAIKLLDAFLSTYTTSTQRADALFRLAELHWERSETAFLKGMESFDRSLEAFRSGNIAKRPDEPRLDLKTSIRIYEEILERHRNFAHTDTVLYLYGFALNEQGEEEAALGIFKALIQQYPQSVFFPDAQLAVGEYYFSKNQFGAALASYETVLSFSDNPLYELAAYKTAWCYFKEGRSKEAALRFREVLRRAKEKKSQSSGRINASFGDMEKEALEDLALTFSESGGAKEALRFMDQVGGEEYSVRVLRSVGEVFFRQARFDEAIESFRTLVDTFPLAEGNPEDQLRIAESCERMGKQTTALQERQRLAERYGPGSSWAKHHQGNAEVIEKANRLAEESLRLVALSRHKKAQSQKTQQSYQSSMETYEFYLKMFPNSEESPKMHFYLAEVLYQLGKFGQAAAAYGQAASKTKDPSLKKDASYAAIMAFEQLRQREKQPSEPAEKEEPLSDADNGFLQAVDEFGKIVPDDPKLPQLRFEVGKMCYTHGQFGRASQQLLALVQRHPRDPFAEPAADLALDCFTRTKDWASLEQGARQLIQQASFQDKDLGKKLPGFVAGAIFQNASVLAKSNKHDQAAREFERLASEFPKDPLAPKALFFEAVSLDAAGEKEKAISVYQRIVDRYPDQAAEALFVIAAIYERQYDFEKASHHYAMFAEKFSSDARSAVALLQASRLASARGAFEQEAQWLVQFTKSYPKHAKAAEALFQAAIALERAGKLTEAEHTFETYMDAHAAKEGKPKETLFHLGQIALNRGKPAKSRPLLERCGAIPSKGNLQSSELDSAAHCRFLLGEMVFDEYRKIELRPPKNRLIQLLKEKAALLKKAEGLFTQVVAAGHMEWASAALFRIGDMYAQFSDAIYKSPLPSNLNEKELEVYKQELQSLAYPIEDKALSAFKISHEMALRHRYFSQWSYKTVEFLRKLDPSNHPREEEVRPGTSWADSLTTFPLHLQPLPIPPSAVPPGSREGNK